MEHAKEVSIQEILALHEDVATLVLRGESDEDVDEFVRAAFDAMLASAEEAIGLIVPYNSLTILRGDPILN